MVPDQMRGRAGVARANFRRGGERAGFVLVRQRRSQGVYRNAEGGS
jgi:hypothetical protein